MVDVLANLQWGESMKLRNMRFRTKIFFAMSVLLLVGLTAMFIASTAIIQKPIIQYMENEIERVYHSLEQVQERIISTQLLQGALLTVRQDLGWALESHYVDPREVQPDLSDEEYQQAKENFKKEAIATIKEQVETILSSSQGLIDPDFVIITDLTGLALYSKGITLENDRLHSTSLWELTQLEDVNRAPCVHKGRLYQSVLQPITLSGQVKGYLCLGFQVDSNTVGEIVNSSEDKEDQVGIGAIYVTFLSPEGRILASNIPETFPATFKVALVNHFNQHLQRNEGEVEGRLNYQYQNSEMSGRFWPILDAFGDPLAYQIILTSKTQALSFIDQLRTTFFLIAVIALVGSGLFGYLVSRSVTKPVDHLVHAASQLEAGNLEYKIDYHAEDEMGKLAETLEHMRISILNRIEQIKALQEELIKKEKLASVGSMAGAINHEIRNQLSFGMAAELIGRRYPDDEKVQNYTQMILDAKDYILRILDDIRVFTKSEGSDVDYSMTAKNLRETVDKTVNFVKFDADLEGIEVKTELNDCGSVVCDHQRISQVLINLMRNAAHAMDKRGTIQVLLQAIDKQAHIEVHDEGSGIPEENLEKIWEPFFSTKGEKGLGLGLDICKKIVQDHEGKIYCHSTVGKGTTFIIELPLPTQHSIEETAVGV